MLSIILKKKSTCRKNYPSKTDRKKAFPDKPYPDPPATASLHLGRERLEQCQTEKSRIHKLFLSWRAKISHLMRFFSFREPVPPFMPDRGLKLTGFGQ
ncbi:MAG: hypothetical protein R3E95_05395 [Thiolinea sp.]